MKDPSIQSFERPIYTDDFDDNALSLSDNSFHIGVYLVDKRAKGAPLDLPETMGRFVSYTQFLTDPYKKDSHPLVPCSHNFKNLNMETSNGFIKESIKYGSCANPEQAKVKGTEMQGLE